jgi:hypothetical protein
MDDITGLELFGRAVERQFLEACQFLMDANDSVAAVVAITNGDSFGVEEDEGSMEGG